MSWCPFNALKETLGRKETNSRNLAVFKSPVCLFPGWSLACCLLRPKQKYRWQKLRAKEGTDREADGTESQIQRDVCRELWYLYYKNVQRNSAQGGKLNYTEIRFLENTEVMSRLLSCSVEQR